jgi:hypothetical protein
MYLARRTIEETKPTDWSKYGIDANFWHRNRPAPEGRDFDWFEKQDREKQDWE